MSDLDKQPTIILAAGRIRCRRCSARSKRTRLQCGAPAMRGKRVCATHGGKSSGPKTEAGKQRIAASKTVHGFETRQLRIDRSRQLGELRTLEDAGHALDMFGGVRTRGRKPAHYLPIKTVEQAKRWVLMNIAESLGKGEV